MGTAMKASVPIDRDFALLFMVMLTIAAGNTALQSVLPALGRSLHVADSGVAAAFSVSALLWVIAAPIWAKRSDRHGRRAMILLGLGGFALSLSICGCCLVAGINGWIAGATAFLAFIGGRLVYGIFGAAAPPAVQALVAGRTTREQRTKALTLLASAFGLGTILGPAIAPYLILGSIGAVRIGLAGPAFIFALFGLGMFIAVYQMLANDAALPHTGHGAATAYPSIGGQSSGASITAATAHGSEQVGYLDPRVRAWMIAGLIMGHDGTGHRLSGDRPAASAPGRGAAAHRPGVDYGGGRGTARAMGADPAAQSRSATTGLGRPGSGGDRHSDDGTGDLALFDRAGLCPGLTRLRLHPTGLYRRGVPGGWIGSAGFCGGQGHER
jgi:MFS family permease